MPGKWVKFARYCSLERTALIAVICFTIASCASSGTDFRTDSLSQLQPGLSTESDAITALDSPPTQRINNADGTHLLVWSHAKVAFGDVESKAISIIFDSDGVMLGFNRGVNVDLPITEPSGRQLGIYVTSRLPNGEYMPIISTLKKGGVAETAGWRPGDIIVSVDNKPVTTLSEVVKATQAGNKAITYILKRDDETITSQVVFAE